MKEKKFCLIDRMIVDTAIIDFATDPNGNLLVHAYLVQK